MMVTTQGLEVHLVGVGVCGQRVFQVNVGKGSKRDHDAWKLCREITLGELIEFGKNPNVHIIKKVD